jgi:hypothetical protein
MNIDKQIAGKISAEKKKMKKMKKEVMLAVVGNENTSNIELEESYPINQTEQDSVRTNLTENDSDSQNKEESMS